MEQKARRVDRLELAQKYLSIFIAIVSFWIIAVYWNEYTFGNLALIPRLGFGAAISWVVFLHTEATSMILMSMMRERWQSEAREAREREAQAREREAQALMREAMALAMAEEARARAAQAQAMEAREARAEAREERAAAREAQTQEILLAVLRRLEGGD